MITDPVTIGPDATLERARRAVRHATASPACRSSTSDGVLLGIITNRDLRFVPGAEWATPARARGDDADAAGHRAGRHLRATTRRRCCAKHKIEKLPLVDDDGPAAPA